MCKDSYNSVNVKIAADLSYTGQERWDDKLIDKCISGIVKALQEGGIDMRGSCCGHDKLDGQIVLQDGRTLLVLDEEKIKSYLKFINSEDD